VNGFVLPDRLDADAAAWKIVLLLDTGRRAAMGEAGRRMASMHGWDRLAEEVAGVYEKVAGARPPGRKPVEPGINGESR
jgi:glycosyltransferase involved in cell wall biosynthesis